MRDPFDRLRAQGGLRYQAEMHEADSKLLVIVFDPLFYVQLPCSGCGEHVMMGQEEWYARGVRDMVDFLCFRCRDRVWAEERAAEGLVN